MCKRVCLYLVHGPEPLGPCVPSAPVGRREARCRAAAPARHEFARSLFGPSPAGHSRAHRWWASSEEVCGAQGRAAAWPPWRAACCCWRSRRGSSVLQRAASGPRLARWRQRSGLMACRSCSNRSPSSSQQGGKHGAPRRFHFHAGMTGAHSQQDVGRKGGLGRPPPRIRNTSIRCMFKLGSGTCSWREHRHTMSDAVGFGSGRTARSAQLEESIRHMLPNEEQEAGTEPERKATEAGRQAQGGRQ